MDIFEIRKQVFLIQETFVVVKKPSQKDKVLKFQIKSIESLALVEKQGLCDRMSGVERIQFSSGRNINALYVFRK